MNLDGKKVKKEKLEELKRDILELKEKIGLTVLQVGHVSASDVYVRQKRRICEELGIDFEHIKLDTNITTDEILQIIDGKNNDDEVDGLFLQLPVPNHLDASKIQNAISYKKDIDGLTDKNIGLLAHNKECLVACTPQGIIDMLEYYNINLEGKNVVIIGRSDLVGKPLALLMTNKNATVTLCHSYTKKLKEISKNADILVAALGKEKFITKDYIKKDAIVIDVGINVNCEGKIIGDVDYDDVKEKASFITPVPGGVGQMTVYEVAKNTYKAHILRRNNIW